MTLETIVVGTRISYSLLRLLFPHFIKYDHNVIYLDYCCGDENSKYCYGRSLKIIILKEQSPVNILNVHRTLMLMALGVRNEFVGETYLFS